ncbi:MAG: hypothetical protein AAF798_08480 [Bacteroidota bacterium]
MKLRCTTNSIRLRLRKSDIQLLADTRVVSERLHFPDGSIFMFRLEAKAVAAIQATYAQNTLSIALPLQAAEQWIATEQVGFEVNQALPNGEQLHLLIEKDFPCAHRPHEDKSDTFQELVGDD